MSEEAPEAPAAEGPRPAWRQLRIWLGLGITVAAIAWTVRGVDFSLVVQSLRTARLFPLVFVAIAQVLGLWVRALRWRHMTDSLTDEPIPVVILYRATAVGFMAINLLPFRLGELVRPWFLSQEADIRGSAALGTLVLERAIDFASIAMISGGVLYFHSAGFPAWFRTGAIVFTVLSLAPFGLVVALRLDEARTLQFLTLFVRPLPESVASRALDLITEACRGLGSLKGIRPPLMVAFYSALLWLVIFASVFVFGFMAFDIHFPLGEEILAVYTLHVFTALAAAAPSAPGFFGVFHFACREALGLFGISPDVAVAYGTLVHLGYWLPVTGAGLLVFLRSGMRLADLTSVQVGKGRSTAHR
ncbi:MAG: flippase-like domain-containing protein [Deltaproteobacteria bacterium]|nr:flippase-like domain-containing protein [Deltaproteobacteria bacterium]